MTKIPAFLYSRRSATRLLAAATVLAIPAVLWNFSALAAPSRGKSAAAKSKTRLASLPSARPKRVMAPATSSVLPRYLPLSTLKTLRKQNRLEPLAALQPFWEGHALKTPMRDLLSGPSLDLPPATARNSSAKRSGTPPLRIAQAFPRPIAPASPRNFRPSSNAVPKWVRYPLEFQLAGIALGTRAVDKDRFNRIDRYGLFALHGNPTAVVSSGGGGAVGAAAGAGAAPGGVGGPPGGFPGAPAGGFPGAPAGGFPGAPAGGFPGAPAGAFPGGPPGGFPGGGGGAAGGNQTLQQTPPETATLFPQSQVGGGLPDWALAITVRLDNNHVEWLYKRETYAMGFVVDRLGFVDAIIVAGIQSDISKTQLEDPIHSIKLGDDLRKVLFRYGYPDDLVPLASDPGGSANDTNGAPGGGNGAFRTFDLRYEQSYNVVFSLRNNRVVRIYIFGDPDFFNAQRRIQLRGRY